MISNYAQDKGEYFKDFERYENIVNYHIKNQDRVSANKKYLKNLADSLKLITLKNTASDVKVEANVLEDRLREILKQDRGKYVKNLRTSLKAIEKSREKKKIEIVNPITYFIDEFVEELI